MPFPIRISRLMAVFVLTALLVASTSLVTPLAAEACGPPLNAGSYNNHADEIFAARVLERVPLEHRTQEGQQLTLYKLRVQISDTLKGSTFTGALVTVYVIACTVPEDLPDTDQSGVDLVLYPLYDVPNAPETLTSYIFYARSFGDKEFVLFDNSNVSIQEILDNEVEQARFNISQGYYVY